MFLHHSINDDILIQRSEEPGETISEDGEECEDHGEEGWEDLLILLLR